MMATLKPYLQGILKTPSLRGSNIIVIDAVCHVRCTVTAAQLCVGPWNRDTLIRLDECLVRWGICMQSESSISLNQQVSEEVVITNCTVPKP